MAVPHTKHPSVDRLVGTVAVSRGVDFDSLDGSGHLFFLLIFRPIAPAITCGHWRIITRQLRDDTFCRFLKQSKTQERFNPLEEADNNQFGS